MPYCCSQRRRDARTVVLMKHRHLATKRVAEVKDAHWKENPKGTRTRDDNIYDAHRFVGHVVITVFGGASQNADGGPEGLEGPTSSRAFDLDALKQRRCRASFCSISAEVRRSCLPGPAEWRATTSSETMPLERSGSTAWAVHS